MHKNIQAELVCFNIFLFCCSFFHIFGLFVSWFWVLIFDWRFGWDCFCFDAHGQLKVLRAWAKNRVTFFFFPKQHLFSLFYLIFQKFTDVRGAWTKRQKIAHVKVNQIGIGPGSFSPWSQDAKKEPVDSMEALEKQ